MKGTRSHVPEMAPNPGEPAGMERDSHGRAIPLKKRLPEDRAKTKRGRTPRKGR
jgi:hypothetical protein